MGNIGFCMGYVVSMRRAGMLKWCMLACWFLVPVLLQTVQHPTDAAGFWYWLNSQPVPRTYTSHQIFVGEIEAIMALAFVGFMQLVVTVLFYRKAQFPVMLWPLPVLLVGFIGNAGWWFGTGTFDPTGALAGFMPAALAGICTAICGRLGENFVFGPGNRSQFDPVGGFE
jgi:hypothetical protein